jgi:molybdopterin-guanine dinucleotide biosynthesis protein A
MSRSMNELLGASPELDAARRELLGVVLAGGRSSRMGSDKARLILPGESRIAQGSMDPTSAAGVSPRTTFLEQAVDRLRPVVGQVAVSGRSQVDLAGWGACLEGVLAIEDTRPGEGPAGGVCESLRLAERLAMSAVLITPVDMPDLGTAELWQLVRAWSHGGGIVCGAFAAGRPEPLVAIYPVAELAAVERLLRSTHRSLSRYLGERAPVQVMLSVAAGRNVNTPADLGEAAAGGWMPGLGAGAGQSLGLGESTKKGEGPG